MNKCMEDCIHLKACRRMCKLYKKNYGKTISRGCNEKCSAYESTSDYYTNEEVESVKIGACYDGQRGYVPGDLLIYDYVWR